MSKYSEYPWQAYQDNQDESIDGRSPENMYHRGA
jgi:hypothetical protein